MDPLYIFLIAVIGIIIAIGVGLEISNQIEEFVIYFLFWMLYIVTIVTFINIILVINYYVTMRNKTGLPGPQGHLGDQGDNGNVGVCDADCRDNICENKILDMITSELKIKTNNSDSIRFNNIYIKSKVRQMCASNEFKQLAPYNGPYNLINYVKDVWKIWIDKLYEAGGIKYFENVSAEIDFEWLKDNPFNEIKQYDIFYWGMGKQYRPNIVDKCYNSSDGDNPDEKSNGSILRVSPTDFFDRIDNINPRLFVNDKVSFWRAKQYTYSGAVYYPVGDLAVGPSLNNNTISKRRRIGNIFMNNSISGPNRETIIVSGDVKGPINYSPIWNNGRFWIWRPIAPLNYISLGDVITLNSNPPLTGQKAPIRCVPYSFAIKLPPSGNILWNSFGNGSLGTNQNLLILGFKPNDGLYVSSSSNNCYNMFRAIVGMDSTNIPNSDINGNFYKLDESSYDTKNVIGGSTNNPPIDNDSNQVGKGYIKIPQKDSKYSIMSYLNLKTNPVLKHQMTNRNINASLIPNAISNAYLLYDGTETNKICLNFDGQKITKDSCDEEKSSQIFSIIFTGNKKNECKLQHYDTKNVINFKSNIFTLVKEDEQVDIEYQMFIMQ